MGREERRLAAACVYGGSAQRRRFYKLVGFETDDISGPKTGVLSLQVLQTSSPRGVKAGFATKERRRSCRSNRHAQELCCTLTHPILEKRLTFHRRFRCLLRALTSYSCVQKQAKCNGITTNMLLRKGRYLVVRNNTGNNVC